MSFGFVEPGERDFDGPFWFFYPLDGTSRHYARLDPLSCEALVAYASPWVDEGTARRMWKILVDDYGSDIYTVQVAAVFAVASQALKKKGIDAAFSASREGATWWIGPKHGDAHLTVSWDAKKAHFHVLRKMT